MVVYVCRKYARARFHGALTNGITNLSVYFGVRDALVDARVHTRANYADAASRYKLLGCAGNARERIHNREGEIEIEWRESERREEVRIL